MSEILHPLAPQRSTAAEFGPDHTQAPVALPSSFPALAPAATSQGYQEGTGWKWSSRASPAYGMPTLQEELSPAVPHSGRSLVPTPG